MKMKSLSCCMVVLALLCCTGAAWSVEPAPAGAAVASVPALPGLDQPAASATPAPAQSPLLDFLAPLTPPPSSVCTCTPSALQCTNTCIAQGGPKCIPTYRCSVGCIATCWCNGSGCL